ncbi:MAG TPA: hypothetical protein VGQ83_28330 [Polyangia bacterium]|jgi:lipopolysaccharide biosynthesis regulator YciM
MEHALLYAVCGIGVFALGVLIGRYYAPDLKPLKRAARQGRSYARALTAVVAGDRDGAAAELGKVVADDVQQVEPYFALGCLFRERGEHERAVRVHQSVLLRRDLDKQARERARYELGQDFLAAGFKRHAIRAFSELALESPKHTAALAALLKLHEGEGEHAEALAVYRKLTSGEGAVRDPSFEAHLLAAQAAAAAQSGDLDATRRRLEEALAIDAGNLHALATWAQLERARGRVSEAATLWERALRAAPELAPWIYPRLEEAFFEAGRLDEVEGLLDALLAREASVGLRLGRARLTARRNPRDATEQLVEILRDAPALLPAREELGRLLLQYGTGDAIRAEYESLLEVLKRLGRGYRCGSCGHAAADLFWQCPGCRGWGTVRLAWGRRAGEGAAPPAAVRVGAAPAKVLPARERPALGDGAAATGGSDPAKAAESPPAVKPGETTAVIAVPRR